jgi:hypothetical protein
MRLSCVAEPSINGVSQLKKRLHKIADHGNEILRGCYVIEAVLGGLNIMEVYYDC